MKIIRSAVFSGLAYALVASIAFSAMATFVNGAKIIDPSVSSFFVSFVRSVVNLVAMLGLFAARRDFGAMWGDKSASLWLRGIFGSLSLMAFFYAIQEIGQGEGTFIQSTSGIFIVVLAPIFLPERFSLQSFFAIAGSFVGLFLLFDPSLGNTHLIGKGAALASGLLGALSMIMVAKAGKENSTECVVFYFCFVSVILHAAFFAVFPEAFPSGKEIWAVMIGAGLAATVGQFLLTKAYQNAPASVISSVCYLSPLLSTVWGIVLFGQEMSFRAFLGCAVVLVCGVVLPFFGSYKVPNRQ